MSKAKELLELLELLEPRMEKAEEKEDTIYSEEDISNLVKLNKSFLKPHNFTKGQLVKWKRGLKNKALPHENQPAIVLDILDTPVYGENDPGSPYFREPLDLILGINENDEFLIFHYDKRRFEPFEQKKAEPGVQTDQ